MRFRSIAVTLASLCAPALLLAHGDLSDRIAALTTGIQRTPGAAKLYLDRAELHRQHSEIDAALADYSTAERLDPALTVIDLARGRMLADAGDWRGALPPLERYLVRYPTSVDAARLRAHALRELDRPAEAAEGFAFVTRAADPPTPDDYLGHADAMAAAGRKDAAIVAIDAGLVRLGPVVALQLRALALELSLGRCAEMLARLDPILSRTPRREAWLEWRARALHCAGRPAEAIAAAREGLEAIAALPPGRRVTPLTTELALRLQQLTSSPPAR